MHTDKISRMLEVVDIIVSETLVDEIEYQIMYAMCQNIDDLIDVEKLLGSIKQQNTDVCFRYVVYLKW